MSSERAPQPITKEARSRIVRSLSISSPRLSAFEERGSKDNEERSPAFAGKWFLDWPRRPFERHVCLSLKAIRFRE